MKSACISIIGRPSSGKSTLLNALCGYKVSIISPFPQTTRNAIRGIVTREQGQLVFIDTPGFHDSDKKFNLYMKELAISSLEEIDLILYVVDTSREPGEEEDLLIQLLSPLKERVIAGLNKIDLPESKTERIKEYISDTLRPLELVRFSAVTGEGIDNLLSALFTNAPEGEQLYPEDFYTDQEPSFRISEIIREKALGKVRQELPHAMYVEIADMEANEEEERLWIRAFLVAERESQKGILIGHKGSTIKSIRLAAQKEIQEVFPYRIHLDLRVKVRPKWRKNDSLLKDLIK